MKFNKLSRLLVEGTPHSFSLKTMVASLSPKLQGKSLPVTFVKKHNNEVIVPANKTLTLKDLTNVAGEIRRSNLGISAEDAPLLERLIDFIARATSHPSVIRDEEGLAIAKNAFRI
jgi:hypothetical protein